MYGSRIALTALLVALNAATAAAEGGEAGNAGRMALLADEAAALSREAELLTGSAPEPPPVITEDSGRGRFGSIPVRLPSGSMGGVTLGVLALATLTGYLATRARARAVSGARPDELREVTWRFRSPRPIRVSGESAHRVAAVLDEIEELGQKLRAITTAVPENRGPVSHPERAERTAPKVSPPTEAVVFSRRTPIAAPPEAEPVPAPAPAPVDGAGMSRLQLREAVYTQARRLLRAGEDRLAVREATGLKLAEIDLLRCARAGEKAA